MLSGLGAGSGLAIAVLAGLLVNARLMVYSASVAGPWRTQRRWRKSLAASLLTDVVWAVATRRNAEPGTDAERRRFYLGAASTLWLGWLIMVSAAAVDEVRPHTILTFGPDGMTGHPDHRAVSAWTTAAWRAAGAPGQLLYTTLTPDSHAERRAVNEEIGLWMSGTGPVCALEDLAFRLRPEGAALDRKLVALKVHGTQTAGLIERLGEDTFRDWWAVEEYVAAGPDDFARDGSAGSDHGGRHPAS